VRNALTLIPSTGLPPARARLVNLTRRISDAESQLARLVRGRDQLRAELSRADVARNELDSLINEDASSLAGKMRAGVSWTLAHFGSAKAMNLVAALSESQIQLGVGTKALAAIESEIATAQREVSDLKSGKEDAVRAVLLEASAGFREEVYAAITDLRESLTIIAALERVVARSDGSYQPNERIVIEIPAIGGRPAEAVVVPEASIVAGANVWGKYAETLGENPLSSIDEVLFPPVNPNADNGRLTYDRLSATERKAVDKERSQGVK